MRFAANLSMLFGHLPLVDRAAAAAAAGFGAVESWWPWSGIPSSAEMDAFAATILEHDLTLAALNIDGGDFEAGERGLLALPDAQARFRDGVRAALEIAEPCGCRTLNALYGQRPPGGWSEATEETAVENLRFASLQAASIGAKVVLEALNPEDFPDYGLHHQADSASLADRAEAAGAQPIGLLFDVYHAARAGDDVVSLIERNGPRIYHIQVADVPGRQHPGSGRLPFGRIWSALGVMGYQGYVGLEYIPSDSPAETFGWMGALPFDRSDPNHVTWSPPGALSGGPR
jgi:hydroxypyruvate isomerase